MPISRMQQPRQMYGLGSFVKKAVKGVTGAIKKIAGSGLGKAALLGLGGAGLMGMGPLSALGGLGAGSGTGIASILSKGKSLLGGLTTGQRLAGSLGLAALASAPQEVQEESSRDIGALKKYLASYYENLGYSADEIAENVERDTAEYTSGAGGYAEGGRIGYREGNLAMGPGSGFTLKPPGELAYDATNTNIYGSSAASFTPKTIMNQSGNQVQAGFGKTPGMQPGGLTLNPGATIDPNLINDRPRPGTAIGDFINSGGISNVDSTLINDRPRPSGGLTLNPGATIDPIMGKPLSDYMRPGNIPGTNTPYSTLRGEQPLPDFMRPGGVVLLNQPFMGKGGPEAFDNVPNRITDMRYRDPGPGIGTGGILEGARRGLMSPATPSNPQLTEIGTGNLASYANNGQLPIGQPQPISEERMDALNRSVVGNGIYDMLNQPPQLLQNTRIMPATPVPFQTVAQPMPFAQQANSSSPIAQVAQMANGGRMGYQDGSPEENAIQASGIMNLPLNQNPAGITELDLRETGGFIPPVGVKEKADDIPAMLSNNEFVFTADAVRGMGDGNVNKGAQRMYDMMKKLEKGGRV